MRGERRNAEGLRVETRTGEIGVPPAVRTEEMGPRNTRKDAVTSVTSV